MCDPSRARLPRWVSNGIRVVPVKVRAKSLVREPLPLVEFRTRCTGVVIVVYAVALSVATLWMFQRRDVAGARGE